MHNDKMCVIQTCYSKILNIFNLSKLNFSCKNPENGNSADIVHVDCELFSQNLKLYMFL